MTGNNRQTVNSIMREVRNNVITTKKKWKKDCGTMIVYYQAENVRNNVSCMTLYGKMQETLFLHIIDRERKRKQCVWSDSNVNLLTETMR